MNSDTWIQTYTGRQFYFYAPEKNKIHVEDIIHPLSQLCRFNGHTKKLYTVAQHSVIVSELVPEEYALEALLHDAPEAFISDLPKPFKETIREKFSSVESAIYARIAKPFGLPEVISEETKVADLKALALEKEQLLSSPQHDSVWGLPDWVYEELPDYTIDVASPHEAREMFRERLHQLADDVPEVI